MGWYHCLKDRYGSDQHFKKKTAENETNDSQSPSRKVKKQLVSSSMQEKLTSRMSDDTSVVELATDAVEHPSPVSVLDDSLCRDDVLSPPVKQISLFLESW